MSLQKRYVIFLCGLFFMSLGICLIIKSSLGTSPISSIPYILSLKFPLTLGMFTFIVNMIFFLGQMLILRRSFPSIQFWQIPVTILFSCFMDAVMLLLADLTPESYSSKIIVLLLGCLVQAMGVALQIIAGVVMLAGEGLLYAMMTGWHVTLGKTKTFLDVSLVVLAAFFSLYYFQEVRGIREGTLISALSVGLIARFYVQHFSFRNEVGRLIFRLPFKGSGHKV